MSKKAQLGRRRILVFVIALVIVLAAVAVVLLVTKPKPAAEIPAEAPKVVIANLKTCRAVEGFSCVGETRDFKAGDAVFLTFDVYAYSANINGAEKVNFYEDIALIGPDGSTIFSLDAATATIYDKSVAKPGAYTVSMTDSIATLEWAPLGQYVVTVAVGSVSLNATSTAVKLFSIT